MNLRTQTRSLFLLAALLVFFPSTRAGAETDGASPLPDPIVFVHGNGDDAAKWIGIMWLFESNGYPSNRLFAIRFTHPVARTSDGKEEPDRSSTSDSAAELSAFVTRVLLETKSSKVVLVGSSRGGLTIRNYVVNGGGRGNVSAAILAGTPNHGVMAGDANLGNEFNGRGPFLQALNHSAADGAETVPGIRFLTLRSDKLDKYAQPASAGGGVGYDGPALHGAENTVLANLDHRELAFQPTAFAAMYTFLTGKTPTTLKVKPEETPTISGVITGFASGVPTNLPLAGAKLRVYAVPASGQAVDAPLYEVATKEDGKWGPLQISSRTEYEFDIEYHGRHVRYYKAPLPRSSSLLNLRFLPVPSSQASAGTSANSVQQQEASQVFVERPQGYFSHDRDPVLLDGKPVAEEPGGLPTRDAFLLHVPSKAKVQVSLRQESITAQPSGDLTQDLPVVDFLW